MPVKIPNKTTRLTRLFKNKTFYALLLFFGLLYLLLLMSVGFILPHLVKTYAPEHIETWLERPVQLTKININPINLHVKIEGFALQEKNNQDFVGFKGLNFTFHFWASIFHQAITLSNVNLTEPYMNITRLPNSPNITFNFSDILKRLANKDDPQKTRPNHGDLDTLPQIIVDHIHINNASAHFTDLNNQRRLQYQHINLSLNSLNSKIKIKNGNPEKHNTYQISLVGENGGEIDTQGQLQLYPFDLKGKITLKHLSLPVLWEVIADEFPVQLQQGHLEGSAHYHLFTSEKQQTRTSSPFINVTLNNAEMSITDLTLSHQNTRFLSSPFMKIDNINLNLGKRSINIEQFTSQALNIHANIDKQGIDIIKFITPSKQITQPNMTHSSSKAPNWKVKLNKADIKQAKLNVTETLFSSPQLWQLANIHITTGQMDAAFSQPIQYSAAFSINQQGQVNAKGAIDLQDLSSSSDIHLYKISLAQFKPYLAPYLHFNELTGTLQSQGKVTTNKQQQMDFTGKLAVNDFTLTMSEKKALLSWQALSIPNMTFNQQANNLLIDTINLKQAKINLIRNKNGQFNIESLIPIPSTTTEQAQTSTQDPIPSSDKPLEISINQVNIHDSSHKFIDRSVSPVFISTLDNINGSITQIHSTPLHMAPFNLSAKINTHTPMTITGSIAPFSAQANTQFDLKLEQLHLPPISAYSGHYVGYDMTQGLMSIQSNYQIKDQTLIGDNQIVIEQIHVKNTPDSEPQISLPLPLAIALLEDKQGIITLNLPVSGDLNAPEFNIANILNTSFIKLITKTISAPFTLLSSLLTTDIPLNSLYFDAASSQITQAQQQTLSQLGRGLRQRPKLTILIAHTDTQVSDKKALSTEQLHAKIATLSNINVQNIDLGNMASYVDNQVLSNALMQIYEKESTEKPITLPFENLSFETLEQPNTTEATIKSQQQIKYQALYNHLLDIQTVSPSQIHTLWDTRLNKVKDFLVNKAQITADRIQVSNTLKHTSSNPLTLQLFVN
ncbi:DUF748 domain-containing protein [uncultured Shewanella sp.]|uniref:DUF748 domain-containing protein n=1 Tax=uncultured Shewanella sp. TaxID=173975 RepID=UPI002616CCF5|nr:DUF748 domain-containing protein [uncultured Shewanella sp.]